MLIITLHPHPQAEGLESTVDITFEQISEIESQSPAAHAVVHMANGHTYRVKETKKEIVEKAASTMRRHQLANPGAVV